MKLSFVSRSQCSFPVPTALTSLFARLALFSFLVLNGCYPTNYTTTTTSLYSQHHGGLKLKQTHQIPGLAKRRSGACNCGPLCSQFGPSRFFLTPRLQILIRRPCNSVSQAVASCSFTPLARSQNFIHSLAERRALHLVRSTCCESAVLMRVNEETATPSWCITDPVNKISSEMKRYSLTSLLPRFLDTN